MREQRSSVIWHRIRHFYALALGILGFFTPATFSQAAGDSKSQVALPKASVYRSIAGRDLRIFEFPTKDTTTSAQPAILLVPGGAWSRGNPEQLFRSARFFAEQGFVSLVLEYRLADATNSPVESFSDVCSALAFLRNNASTLGITPSRIALWGISSSGQLVASTETVGCNPAAGKSVKSGPDAMLLVSPVVDAVSDGLFRDLMKGHGEPSSLSPAHNMTRGIAKTFIVQGDADHTTPIERSRAFCNQATALGSWCEVIALEGQGHVLDRPSRDMVLDMQVSFLKGIWQ